MYLLSRPKPQDSDSSVIYKKYNISWKMCKCGILNKINTNMLKIPKTSVWWIGQPVYIRQFYKIKHKLKPSQLYEHH